jgi:broad specificity phosphatase PhoE
MARMEPPDRIVASPLRRAVQTAEIAFAGQPVTTDPRLMELHFGAFEGRTLTENLSDDAWEGWARDPYLQAAPGGESYRELRERAVAWYRALPEDAAHVVAVSHSGTIQMLLAHVLGIEHPRWRKRIYLRHSSVTRILVGQHDTVVERVNDTRHLDENGDDPFWE